MFWVLGVRYRGCRVAGLESRRELRSRGVRVWGQGLWYSIGQLGVRVVRFRINGFRVLGFKLRVYDVRFRVPGLA